MKTVTLTKGLPASGKTTWAKNLIDNNPGMYKRVSKDDLRAMMDNGKWSSENEKFVLKIRDSLIVQAINEGYHVIVDDTNLNPVHAKHIADLIKGVGVVIFEDFTSVPLETCLERDAKRTNSVGSKVIKGMWKQFLKPAPLIVEQDPKLPDAIICDIDGTLALFGAANPYNRDYSKDTMNETIRGILYYYMDSGNKLILVSGRMESAREVTEDWLSCNGVNPDGLFMRRTNDTRKDAIVKKELYEDNIKGKYNVKFVLDDRNRVVEMWREQGLICLQVAEGDF